MSAKRPWAPVEVGELEAAFETWPGSLYEKGRLYAFLLRVRVEIVVSSLPPSVVREEGPSDRAARRLLLSIGEPGLDGPGQERRWGVVREAIAAYEQICDLLHGEDPHPYPPLPELAFWSRVVDDLEREFLQSTV